MDKNINFNALIEKTGKCCLTKEACGSCKKEECLVGYCEQSLLSAFKAQDEFIDDGMDYIPYEDTKIYDEEKFIEAIAFTLNQCKNCQLYHDDDCIINIIRSSLEVGLLGDYIDYKGSTLMYFTDLGNKDKEISARVYSAFKQNNNQ